jgi:uncharacterized protein
MREAEMAQLWNKSSNKMILEDLKIAVGFLDRGVGLLKYKSLPLNQGLWIHRCNSIHTFFMRFSIDCIFVDKELRVKSLRSAVAPWRFVLPQWGADSVFEVPIRTIQQQQIKKGDQLHVVS